MAAGKSNDGTYGGIPHAFIQELNERADLAEIIGAQVKLQKRGSNYFGLCPFHAEKTPSFSVNADKGFYHCFGCGAHGNALSYYRHLHNNDFIAAVEALAKRLGLQVPRVRAGGKPVADHGGILRAALEHWKLQLHDSKTARAYLQKRGLTEETIERFGLGYAPDRWDDLGKALAKHGSKKLLAAGLQRESNGKIYDYFRNRIMFPIFDRSERLVGFGGRSLDPEDKAKYLNSAEQAHFSKKRILYGMPQAAAAVRERGRLIICEGYVDVLMLAQVGFGEAVATMGTAATAEQMKKATQAAKTIILAFDGDAAGQKGAQRALGGILPALADGVSIRFLFLPQGDDPDSYINKNGRAAFEKLLDDAMPLQVFLVRALEQSAAGLDGSGRASKMLAEGERLLRQIKVPQGRYTRQYLSEHLSQAVGMASAPLARAVNTAPQPAAATPTARTRMNPGSPLFALLCCLAANPQCIDDIDEDLPLPGTPQDAQVVMEVLNKIRWGVVMEQDSDGDDDGGDANAAPDIVQLIAAAGYAGVAEQVRRALPMRFTIAKNVGADLQNIIGELRAHHQKQLQKSKLLAALPQPTTPPPDAAKQK